MGHDIGVHGNGVDRLKATMALHSMALHLEGRNEGRYSATYAGWRKCGPFLACLLRMAWVSTNLLVGHLMVWNCFWISTYPPTGYLPMYMYILLDV
jgi:hypothetical protein